MTATDFSCPKTDQIINRTPILKRPVRYKLQCRKYLCKEHVLQMELTVNIHTTFTGKPAQKRPFKIPTGM